MQRLVTHQFGNYVLQKAINIVADPELKTTILESIKLLSGSLSQTKHGQKVLTKLQKAYPHVFVGASSGAKPSKQQQPSAQNGSSG